MWFCVSLIPSLDCQLALMRLAYRALAAAGYHLLVKVVCCCWPWIVAAMNPPFPSCANLCKYRRPDVCVKRRMKRTCEWISTFLLLGRRNAAIWWTSLLTEEKKVATLALFSPWQLCNFHLYAEAFKTRLGNALSWTCFKQKGGPWTS